VLLILLCDLRSFGAVYIVICMPSKLHRSGVSFRQELESASWIPLSMRLQLL
jgi:hypothetical protein